MPLDININAIRDLEKRPRDEQMLGAALVYASRGSRVLPLEPNSKAPALPSWDMASSDPATLNKWFGPGGEHVNGNMALLIDGYRVIDIDRHEGQPDGFKTLNGALDKVMCPRADTPHNGQHLVASATDLKPAPGVEILMPGTLFTVFPSQIDGVQYRWLSGGKPAPVNRIRGIEKTAPAPAAVALAPAGYVAALLEYIDPDVDYGTWLKVGMSIHHNDAGQAGLTVWDEWSSRGAKYKQDECSRRWQTFDAHRGKPVALRWLIIEAVKNGRQITREDMLYHGGVHQALEIERINEKYGLYDAGGTLYVAYKENGAIHMADPYNFKVKLADQKVESDGKLRPVAEVWLEHPDRRIVTEVGMWIPGTEPEGALNSYEGFAVDPVPCDESDIKMVLDFMLDDICRGNVAYYEFLMDMLSAKLQKPLQLLKLCLVMRGGEGVGKGALTRIMENIIGPKHSVNISAADSWLGKFSGSFIKGAIWLSANEAYWSGNHTQAERLKALVTEETLDVEEKFVKGYKQKNRLMIAITTNNAWAVPAGQDSRRFFVLDVSNNRANDPAFWDEFHARTGLNDMGEPNDPVYLGKILWWFQHRKIKNSLKRAMETDCLLEQRRESAIDSREDALVTWVRQTFTGELPNDVITGATGESFMVVQRSDGSPHIKTENVYKDYRAFVAKHHKRPRMAFDQGKFTALMRTIGFDSVRVRKGRLTAGNRPLPGQADAEAKIVVMRLPTAEEIEANITKNYGLFGLQQIKDEE